ncbi:MAG: Extracellular solute-binding protein family 3 [Actinobacteria bacterium 66_15]|nr:MAG: Extracellular solute-binding protein family 3 [Actinobacteria bacterium 66_15]
MRLRSLSVYACAILALMLLAGCSAVGGEDVPVSTGPAFQDVDPDPIRIGVTPGGDALPLWVADREGLFGDAGVEAEIVVFESSAERDAALAGGSIDAFVGGIASAMALEISGAPVALVATLADPARSGETTGAALPEGASDGLSTDPVFLGIADHYLALPSGLLASRAVLQAYNAAVVRIQADPGGYRDLLAEVARIDDVSVSTRYLAAAAPGRSLVESLLVQQETGGNGSPAPGCDDLVLDIVR